MEPEVGGWAETRHCNRLGRVEKAFAMARSGKQRWEELDVEIGAGEWVKAGFRWVDRER